MSEPMDDPQEITANFAPDPELSDDGSLTVDLDDAEPGRDAADQEQFTQNLATVISQSTLASVAADLLARAVAQGHVGLRAMHSQLRHFSQLSGALRLFSVVNEVLRHAVPAPLVGNR